MNLDENSSPLPQNGRAACASLIERVSAHVSQEPLPSAEELTQIAGHAFEVYAETLLRELLTAGNNEATIRREFAHGLDTAGAALRQVLAQCCYRHTISQGLQRKMFEAETRLRAVLKTTGRNREAAAPAAAS